MIPAEGMIPHSGRRVLQACQRVGNVQAETIWPSRVRIHGSVGSLLGRGRYRLLACSEIHTNRHVVIGGNSSELEKIRSIEKRPIVYPPDDRPLGFLKRL